MVLPAHLILEIVTPERAIVHETVDEAEIPGSDGYLGVLPGHTPLLVSLQVGELWFKQGEKKTYLSIAFGFAEILPDRIRILAKNAEIANEIDVDRAEAAQGRARERLVKTSTSVDLKRARVALMKSLIRLQVASKVSNRP